MASFHLRRLRRLLFIAFVISGIYAEERNKKNLATVYGDTPTTFAMLPASTEYEDIKLELLGSSAPLVASVTVTLHPNERNTPRTLLPPPPLDDGQASWLLCDSALTTQMDIKINWKKDEDQKEIKIRYSRKNMASSDEWKVKSVAWQYRRLVWSGDGPVSAVNVTSKDILPAVACVRYECEPDVAKLTSTGRNCKPFESATWFKFNRDERLPSYLYVRLANATDSSSVGTLVKWETKRGSEDVIDAGISSLLEMPPPAGGFEAVGNFKKNSQPNARPVTRPRPPRPHTSSKSDHLPHSAGIESEKEADLAPQPETTHDADTATGAEPRGNTNTATAHGGTNTLSASASNVGNPQVNVNVNLGPNSPAGSAGKTKTKTETKPKPKTEPEPEPESEPEPTVDGDAGLEESFSGTVTGQEPRLVRFRWAPGHLEDRPLVLEVTSSGALYAFLMLLSGPKKTLHIPSFGGGLGRLQLCPGHLTSGRLTVTVSTPSEEPVIFTARLTQPDSHLSLGSPEEVELSQNQSSVRELTFPNYRSPIGIKVSTPPNTCLRASVFKRMCVALAGRLKDAIVHKFLSSGDYLPVAKPFDDTLSAFLRTEWAAPERCGLPAVPAAAGPLLALLTMNRHEDSEAWPVVLIPPLTLALALPAMVFWLVRAAAARWRRGPDSDDEGVTISELPETPRLPRHIPRLTTSSPDAEKPALTPAPAPARPAAASVVPEASYADLSEEKRRLAEVVAGVSGDAGYPHLSEEQRREVAEAEQEEESGQRKEQLAAQLGVGGRPAPPSAPAGPGGDGEVSISLLAGDPSPAGDLTPTTNCRTSSDASGVLLVVRSDLGGPLSVTRRLSKTTFCGLAITVLATTSYFSATALQSFFSGNADMCPASAHYTVMSTRLPGVGGLVNLVPTAAFSLCLWYLRDVYTRHAARSLLRRGALWPAAGLEWLLVSYGAQSAVGGLCPGHNTCFTTNTFAVAFVNVLAVSRVPSVRPTLPLAATVTTSALVSAASWLPLKSLALLAAVSAQLISAGALCWRLLVPGDVGNLSAVQKFRLLVPVELVMLAVPQLVTTVLGVLVLSPGGYLATAGLTTLLTTLWATRQRKGTVTVRTPFSPYAWLAQLIGASSFVAAIIIGELANSGAIGLLEASSIGQLIYLVACFSLALGISPRPLRPQ